MGIDQRWRHGITCRRRSRTNIPCHISERRSEGGGLLPDGSYVKNTGGDGQKYGINLKMFVAPQDKGGYGGKVFYDAESGHLILTVNAKPRSGPKVGRVEVPYVRNANDEWRADFSAISPAKKVTIDPTLPKQRDLHFGAANLELAKELKKDPSLD